MQPTPSRKNLFDLQLSEQTRENFLQACKWARIIALCSFISAGLVVVDIVLTLSGINTAPGKEASLGFQLIAAIIGVAISLLLFKFSKQTQNGLRTESQPEFNSGLDNFRLYFKIYGIIIIIALALFAIVLIIAIISAMYIVSTGP